MQAVRVQWRPAQGVVRRWDTVIERAGQWLRANARHAPAAAVVPAVALVFVSVWLVVHSLVLTLVLGSLLTAVLACIWAFIAFATFDARPIAREVLAKKHDVTVPTRTVRAYEVEPSHRAVPALPASTYRMEPTPAYPVDVDDDTFVLPVPPPLPPSSATVTLVPGRPVEWPLLHAARVDFAQPIPVGYDDEGRVVFVKLVDRNLAIAAETGWGKSTVIRMLIAAAALDSNVRLTIFDAKRVTLAKWKTVVDRWVMDDVAQANKVLMQLRAEMRRRYAYMEANRLEVLPPTAEFPLEVLIVDELAEYTDDAEFVVSMTKLASLGRAAGIIPVVATQELRADVIPAKLRNKFVFRWAGRCPDVTQVRMIIGGRYKQAPAHLIGAEEKGLGYLMHEGAEPVKLQAFYIPDPEVDRLVARAEALRRSGSEAGPKRPLLEASLSVDEAARSAPEGLSRAVCEAYAEGWSEYRIATEILSGPKGGDGLRKHIALARALGQQRQPRLQVVRDAEKAGEEHA